MFRTKRVFAVLVSLCMLLMPITSTLAAGFLSAQQCTLDADGTLTAYFGDYFDATVIPAELDGRPVKKLDDALFYGKPIQTVYLEDGIEEIGVSCFAGSDLDYIDLPAGLKKVGDGAFRDCKDLTSLYISSEETVFGKDAFAGTGFLAIAAPCTADLICLHDKVLEAKGDEAFAIDIMHPALVESMVEKDIHGNPLLYCTACGYAFKGYDDIDLPFEDVPEDAWYYPYVLTAYEFGILKGKSETLFDPNADMTLAEAAKMAACVYMCMTDDFATFEADGEAWYQPYVDYCYQRGIIDKHIVFDWEANATRAEMAYLFSRAEKSEYELNPDVPLTDIPDVDEKTMFAENILTLFRRGIATGSDMYYTFYPDAPVKRAEAATFISRILCFDMRVELPKG